MPTSTFSGHHARSNSQRAMSTPQKQWSMSSINELHVVKTLNKGAFAEVYQAIEIASGRAVALKVVRIPLLG
jgi:serine/threonine protein kinase